MSYCLYFMLSSQQRFFNKVYPNIFNIFTHSGSASSCLNNNPNDFIHEPSIFHSKLPGKIINATLQCQLQYGSEYFQCSQKLVRLFFIHPYVI